MPRLPSLTSKKLISLLRQEGFLLDHATGSHYIFYRSNDKKRVIVPFHTKDLPKGTLLTILKEAGIKKEDL